MRQVLAECIKGIPLNPRSRRAIDETLSDWAHEESQAINRGRKTLVWLQGILSVARVLSVSLLRESTDFGWCRGLARRWNIAALCVGVLTAAQACFMFRGLGFESLILVLPWAPLMLLAILPPALLLILAWRPAGRALPTAGAACFLALALLLLAGLLVPLSAKAYYLLLASLNMTPEGVTAVRSAGSTISPIAAALHVMGWPFLGAAVVVLAAKLAARSPLQSRWWLVIVPLIYAAFVAALRLAVGTSFLVFRGAGDSIETPGQALALLTTAVVLMVIAIAYRRGEAQIPDGPSVAAN